MIQNPILKVLSTLSTHQVQHLLMGGQACVLYGGAQFSRDCDIVVLTSPENLDRLSAALNELQAELIAVPPFEAKYLEQGHAVHFRCGRPDVDRVRIDVMSVMRNVDPFEALWRRRTTLTLDEGLSLDLLAVEDLVRAKKTQRDKDWPMIEQLIEAHFAAHQATPTLSQIEFWLRESRTPEMLVRLAHAHPQECAELQDKRPLLAAAGAGDFQQLAAQLIGERERQREADRLYWEPLKIELEQLRRAKR